MEVRGHNEGTIFQRRKGPQEGSWVSAVTMRDGRRVSRTTHSRDDARAALVELIRLRDAGATMTGRIRLGDYLLRWVSSDHDLAPSTIRKHQSIVQTHLADGIGHIRMSELSVEDVDRLLRRLELGPQSVRHVRATLRRALADALRQGLVTRNVAALAHPPKLPHRERTVLDANQARILIESTRGTRYGPLWTILVTTGLRISEALGLAWSDVELGDAVEGRRDAAGRSPSRGEPGSPALTVRHQLARETGQWVRRQPKTAKGRRTIPLTPLGVEALRAQREQQREWRFGDGAIGEARLGQPRTVDATAGDGRQVASGEVDRGTSGRLRRPDRGPREGGRLRGTVLHVGTSGALGVASIAPINGLVFTTEAGRPIHATNLLPKLRADLAAAGLPKVSIHDLRHATATILLREGMPLPTISSILGHSTIRITADIYAHVLAESRVEAADAMQRALG